MDLNDKLFDILRIYKHIPQIHNKRSETDKIIFKYNDKVIHLLTDPNDLEICNYKRIQALCIKHKIGFTNQSFAQTNLNDLGFCVVDNIWSTYSLLIQKLI